MCQTPGQATAGEGERGQKSPDVFLPQSGLSNGTPVWHISPDGLLKMNVPAGAGLGRTQVATDSAMVVHPPQTSIGVQPPGTTVAQNLYPGLELMPIGQSKVKVEPIPTTWPGMKMEPIPRTLPAYTVVPIQRGKTGAAPK